MAKIRLDDAGHVYLDEYDISKYVVKGSIIVSKETVALTVLGDVDDQRTKKAVKSGRKNSPKVY